MKGSHVEIVEHYKVIDKSLNHDLNTSAMSRKGLRRLHFLRRLNTFNVDMVWKPHCAEQKKHLSDTVKVAGKIISTQQLSLSDIYN